LGQLGSAGKEERRERGVGWAGLEGEEEKEMFFLTKANIFLK
jgi:hypothetical protein